jgi:RNA polymerase sigma factor (TIGR02999 family)
MSEVTRILAAIEHGDVRAADELFPLVYQELRQLAAQRMSKEALGQTLQATALVHEVYLRLVGGEDQNWSGQAHFFSAAAEAMRRILVDNARRKRSLKHGGGRKRVDLYEAAQMKGNDTPPDDLIALDEALEKFAKKHKAKADLVRLRYSPCLTIGQAQHV